MEEANYTNFVGVPHLSNFNKTYVVVSGRWDQVRDSFTSLKICFHCTFENVYPLAFKGACLASRFDKQFYLDTTDEGMLFYDGNKNFKIELKEDQWKARGNKNLTGDSNEIFLNTGKNKMV